MMPPRPDIPEIFRTQYDEFLGVVARPLKIDRTLRRELRGINPMYFLPWTMAVFSGEEFVSNIPVEDGYFRDDFKGAPGARSLLGAEVLTPQGSEFDMRRGQMTQAVDRLVKRAERFEDAAVSFATVSTASADLAHTLIRYTSGQSHAFGRSGIPRTPGIRVRSSVDGMPVLEVPQGQGHEDLHFLFGRALGHIATMGPGLTGAHFARDMRGAHATAVHYLSGGVGAQFINQFIERQLTETSDPENTLPDRHYYADGIAAGMQQVGQNPEVQRDGLDLVVMSAVHHAGIEECQAGVRGAHELLNPGGFMAIKAPVHSPGHFAGFDALIEVMNDSFKVVSGGPLPGARLMSPHVAGEHQHQIDTAYALLQKK